MSKRIIVSLAITSLLLTAAAVKAAVLAGPLDDRFVYPGTLASPANLHFGNGVCDLEFELFDAETAGSQVGSDQVVEDVPVIDFDYRVELNVGGAFGADAFNGDERFMAVATRCVPGSDPPGSPPPGGAFVNQPERERLVTLPFALWAQDAGVDLSGQWHILGNAGTNPADNFVGTLDAQPLGFRTGGVEQMRIGVNGRLGVGTASPDSALHVAGSGDVDAKIEGFQPSLTLERSGSAGHGELGFVLDGDDLRLINFRGDASLVLEADGSVCLGSGC